MKGPIDITDEDIDVAASELRLRLDDPERRAVLKEVASCDVQAGPGCGKTTILCVKLAILSRRWPYRDRGLCVLSHTNVARREIEERLRQSPTLRGLLHYPHFIGTFQAFVDQFLAIPFLRQKRIEVTAIDDERFGSRAWALLGQRYPKALFAIRKFCGGNEDRARGIVASLRLDGAHMGVVHSMVGVTRFPGATSQTGQALVAVKNSLRAEGCFRYEDMYAFAEACLFKLTYMRFALRRRFPWVFVDELQDTKLMQDRIVEDLFATDDCVLQRFGDKNQAIFDLDDDPQDGQSLFGRRKTLFLNDSRRFGAPLAELASPFTSVEPQQLVGNPACPDAPHTVFVFERNSAKQVVPAFADLVCRTVPRSVLRVLPVCVVASRVNPGNHVKDHFPSYLGDYVDDYVPPKAAKPKAQDSFIAYVVEGRRKWAETGVGSEAYNTLTSGILAFLRRTNTRTAEAPPTTRVALHQRLLESGHLPALQAIYWQLLNPAVEFQADHWHRLMAEMAAALGLPLTTEPLPEFFDWQEFALSAAADGVTSPGTLANAHLYATGDRPFPIRFDSIHGVKGETHAATLMVETFARQHHDLRSLIPVLTGQTHGCQLQDSLRRHCKRVYVAMTRPSHLLCLAIYCDHIHRSQIDLMKAAGWKFVRLST